MNIERSSIRTRIAAIAAMSALLLASTGCGESVFGSGESGNPPNKPPEAPRTLKRTVMVSEDGRSAEIELERSEESEYNAIYIVQCLGNVSMFNAAVGTNNKPVELSESVCLKGQIQVDKLTAIG